MFVVEILIFVTMWWVVGRHLYMCSHVCESTCTWLHVVNNVLLHLKEIKLKATTTIVRITSRSVKIMFRKKKNKKKKQFF